MAVTSDPPFTLPNLLTSIDMSSLTHSELLSLSLLSNTTTTTPFSHSPSNDAVSNSFNESGSTHKQTYSDTSPHKLHLHRHRHLHRRHYGLSLLKRERLESNSIVNFLKQYLQLDNSAIGGERKRKMGEKVRRENDDCVVEIVNRNGVVVDLAALEEEERESEGGPFGAELRRRAAGMEREEELLVMLAEMEGVWCSRRKKRRVVKACLLGDALPVGWKLIIALRRKGGRFSPYCRRYVRFCCHELASLAAEVFNYCM